MDEEIERWVELYDYPLYEISSMGRVKNRASGHILKAFANNMGVATVGLRREGRTYTRALAKLVAAEFLEEPTAPQGMDAFNTVLHLDHDRMNCAASNLLLRPRWWAVKWEQEWRDGPTYHRRIMHAPTATIFETAWHAGHASGMLEESIFRRAELAYNHAEDRGDWIFYIEE